MITYLLLAFLTGVNIVLNMMLNAKASQKAGQAGAMLVNYLTAVVTSVALCLATAQGLPSTGSGWDVPLPYFLGGVIGVATTFLFNVIVPRVPAFSVVVLRFIGQMMASAAIDYFYFHVLSTGKVFGGALFLAGLLLNARAEQAAEKPAEKQAL